MPQDSKCRKFLRIPVDRPAYVSNLSSPGKAEKAYVHVLGEGGCLLVSENFQGVGRVVMLDIFLNGSIPSRFYGKVLYEYCNHQFNKCSGIQFVCIEEKDRKILVKYILDRATSQTADIKCNEKKALTA